MIKDLNDDNGSYHSGDPDINDVMNDDVMDELSESFEDAHVQKIPFSPNMVRTLPFIRLITFVY